MVHQRAAQKLETHQTHVDKIDTAKIRSAHHHVPYIRNKSKRIPHHAATRSEPTHQCGRRILHTHRVNAMQYFPQIYLIEVNTMPYPKKIELKFQRTTL